MIPCRVGSAAGLLPRVVTGGWPGHLTCYCSQHTADTPGLTLVTAHRRENFGRRFENICVGLKALAERNSNMAILYPVHLNPNVQGLV